MDDSDMNWLKSEIKDIGKDTDKLLSGDNMSNSFESGMLAGALNGNGFGNMGFVEILLLAI